MRSNQQRIVSFSHSILCKPLYYVIPCICITPHETDSLLPTTHFTLWLSLALACDACSKFYISPSFSLAIGTPIDFQYYSVKKGEETRVFCQQKTRSPKSKEVYIENNSSSSILRVFISFVTLRRPSFHRHTREREIERKRANEPTKRDQ